MNQKEETRKFEAQLNNASMAKEEFEKKIRRLELRIDDQDEFLEEVKRDIIKLSEYDGERFLDFAEARVRRYRDELAKKKELEKTVNELKDLYNTIF